MDFRSFFYALISEYSRQNSEDGSAAAPTEKRPGGIKTSTHGGGKMRTRITLACTECKQRNYNTTKDKKAHPDRMETKKYCRFCKRHTMHKETK